MADQPSITSILAALGKYFFMLKSILVLICAKLLNGQMPINHPHLNTSNLLRNRTNMRPPADMLYHNPPILAVWISAVSSP